MRVQDELALSEKGSVPFIPFILFILLSLYPFILIRPLSEGGAISARRLSPEETEKTQSVRKGVPEALLTPA